MVVGLGLMSKSLSKVMKWSLNSEPLSQMTLRGQGYLINQVLNTFFNSSNITNLDLLSGNETVR